MDLNPGNSTQAARVPCSTRLARGIEAATASPAVTEQQRKDSSRDCSESSFLSLDVSSMSCSQQTESEASTSSEGRGSKEPRHSQASPQLSSLDYFPGTSMPKQGWFLPCSVCRIWTGFVVQPNETDELPCCRRCEPQFWQLRYKSQSENGSTSSLQPAPSEPATTLFGLPSSTITSIWPSALANCSQLPLGGMVTPNSSHTYRPHHQRQPLPPPLQRQQQQQQPQQQPKPTASLSSFHSSTPVKEPSAQHGASQLNVHQVFDQVLKRQALFHHIFQQQQQQAPASAFVPPASSASRHALWATADAWCHVGPALHPGQGYHPVVPDAAPTKTAGQGPVHSLANMGGMMELELIG